MQRTSAFQLVLLITTTSPLGPRLSSLFFVQCQQVTVDRECYPPGAGRIQITYSPISSTATTGDENDNWLGLVPVGSLNDNDLLVVSAEDLADWTTAADATTTNDGSNTVSVTNTLAVGKYVAVLLRGPVPQQAAASYQGLASSPVLTVATDCTTRLTDTSVLTSTTTTTTAAAEAPAGTTTSTITSSATTANLDNSSSSISGIAGSDNVGAARDLAGARTRIVALLGQDVTWAPQFLRLLFHDCIGGCDGCVDLTNAENYGLERPIDALEAVYEQYGGGTTTDNSNSISRADVWALAATAAVDVVQSPSDAIDFPFVHWGRRDCTTRETCTGQDGRAVPCRPKSGPHRDHPTMHVNTAALYHFFATQFAFTAREAIVAMAGGHTIGSQSVTVRSLFPPANSLYPHETGRRSLSFLILLSLSCSFGIKNNHNNTELGN
jgi:Peroxidase